MTPDVSVGRIMTVDEAMTYYQRVMDAEKVMGKLTREEKMVILKTVGQDITLEALQELMKAKKVLRIKGE